MASQRLNAMIRNAIIEAAVNRKFASEMAQLEQDQKDVIDLEKSLPEMAYKMAFSPDIRKKIKSIPEGWLLNSDLVMVNVEGKGMRPVFVGDRPIPNRYVYNGYGSAIPIVIVTADHEYFQAETLLAEKRAALDTTRKEIKDKTRALEKKVSGVVNSVTTTKRLLEVWPEVQELLPKGSMVNGDMLPAIVLDDLNKELGL